MLMPLLASVPMLAASIGEAQPITTGDLVRQMTDLRALAQPSAHPHKTIQFSSYDRRSVAPYRPGWFANSDGFGREPHPNFLATIEEPGDDGVGRYLMAEVEGPGAMVRTWAAAINGTVSVTLDGSSEPIYDGPAAEFLSRTYSALAMKAGIIDEPVGSGFKQCEACYFPIPFAEGLRIEWTGRLDRLHFYQIETRCYEPGTPVHTFSLRDLDTYAEQIDTALAALREPSARLELQAPDETVGAQVELGPREGAKLLELSGPAAIQELRMQLDSDDPHQALRQVILKGHFDGAPKPQIEAPIGDFFGAGPGICPYDSIPMTMEPDGTMICRFVMPFGDSALFTITNYGDATATVKATASTVDCDWQENASMHFHAKWRVDHDLVAAGGDESFDVPYICARGRGKLVGVAAMLLNPSAVPTSGGNWWGEGDEKIWLDDDTFPSLFGTGSEDYFNYSWSRPALFDHGYCAQPLDTGPDNRGFVVNSRWHILDALPFSSHIEFFMELMHHGRIPDFTYARIAYLYAKPDLSDDHIPITTADVMQGLELPEDWRPVAAGAARGATFHQAKDVVAADAENVRIVPGRMWSAGELLQWTPEADGEKIQFEIDVEDNGRYQVVMTAAFTPDSGRFAAQIDGRDLSPTADLYTPYHTMLRNLFFNLGDENAVELKAGEHTLTLTARGKNDASGGTDIGIDFIWLLPR